MVELRIFRIKRQKNEGSPMRIIGHCERKSNNLSVRSEQRQGAVDNDPLW